MDWVKSTARRDEKHLGFEIWCDLYKTFYGIINCEQQQTDQYQDSGLLFT